MEPKSTHWEITYYGTGMTPMVEKFDNEVRATETWNQWKADPYKGAHSLVQVTVLDER